MGLVREHYADFGPTFASEKLAEQHQLAVDRETLRKALSPETFRQLSGATDSVLTVPVPTIESLGGGSVRCMMAEVFATP